jgi:hypothetical protein
MQCIVLLSAILPLSQNPQFALPIAEVIVVGFLMMLVTATFGYDESSKWNHYAAVLPCSRRKIVASKYLLSLLSIAAAEMLIMLAAIATHILKISTVKEILLASVLPICAAILYFAIMAPAIYKFGVESSRMIAYGFIFLPVSVVTMLGILKVNLDFSFLEDAIFIPVAVVAVLAIVALSYALSARIFQIAEL